MNQAIIIGATSGIGKEVATRLLERGWRVGVAGRREQALAALQESYGTERVVIAPMDVITQESVEKLDDLLKALPSPDLFLYMSGVGYQNVELDEEKELRTVRTNCEGMVRMVDHFLNYVKSNRDYSASRRPMWLWSLRWQALRAWVPRRPILPQNGCSPPICRHCLNGQ